MTFVRETMAFGLIQSGIYLVVHDQLEPSAADWKEYVADLDANADLIRGVIVMTPGPAPNAAQRKQFADMWSRRGANPPVGVLTPNPVVRGVITGLNWFLSRPVRAFDVDQLEAAVAHIGGSSADLPGLRKAAQQLGDQLRVRRSA